MTASSPADRPASIAERISAVRDRIEASARAAGRDPAGVVLTAVSKTQPPEAIDAALTRDDVSQAALEDYLKRYQASFVGKDMATYAKAPKFLETPEMYGQLGELLAEVLHGVYNLDLTPRQRLLPTAMAALRKSRLTIRRLIKIGMQAVRAL